MKTKKETITETAVSEGQKHEKNVPVIEKEKGNAGECLKEIESKLEAAEQEAKENYDRLMRVSADFENYKKRSLRDMEESRKFSNESLIKALLPVVDNLERALNISNSDKQSNEGLLEGVDMTRKEILRIFEKFGVKPIESKGNPFDPALHEAVMQEETDEYPENMVSKELHKGYMMHDRLLRPAMVVVSKAKNKEDRKQQQKLDKNNQ